MSISVAQQSEIKSFIVYLRKPCSKSNEMPQMWVNEWILNFLFCNRNQNK